MTESERCGGTLGNPKIVTRLEGYENLEPEINIRRCRGCTDCKVQPSGLCAGTGTIFWDIDRGAGEVCPGCVGCNPYELHPVWCGDSAIRYKLHEEEAALVEANYDKLVQRIEERVKQAHAATESELTPQQPSEEFKRTAAPDSPPPSR